jgi:hypothetical protein
MTRLTPTTALALCELLSPAFLLWLALTLPQPAVAQTTTLPTLVPIQQLTPTDAEIYPTPGSTPRQVGFGAAIAIQHDTAMISMPDYLDNRSSRWTMTDCRFQAQGTPSTGSPQRRSYTGEKICLGRQT